MSDSAPRLPAHPSLEQLHKQAKELLRQYRAGEQTARNAWICWGSNAGAEVCFLILPPVVVPTVLRFGTGQG